MQKDSLKYEYSSKCKLLSKNTANTSVFRQHLFVCFLLGERYHLYIYIY